MTRHQTLEAPPTPTEEPHGHGDVTHRLRQLLGVGKRELLTMEDLAADYHFPSAEAARKFVRRYVPYVKRGRRLLVDRRDFDATMERMRKA